LTGARVAGGGTGVGRAVGVAVRVGIGFGLGEGLGLGLGDGLELTVGETRAAELRELGSAVAVTPTELRPLCVGPVVGS
jgi:hypothetical protein